MINIAKWTSPDQVFSPDACLAGCEWWPVFPWGFSTLYFWTEPWYQFFGTINNRCLEIMGSLLTGLCITVHCDNETAITAVNAGRFMNSCLREICYFAALQESVLCLVLAYRIISRIFSPDVIHAPYQQRNNSYSVSSAIIGKKFLFLMWCSGFTVLCNIGLLLFQASESSRVLDRISSTHSALHILLELSVT